MSGKAFVDHSIAARRRQVARLQPDEVLSASRRVVAELLALAKAYRAAQYDRAKFSIEGIPVSPADGLVAGIELLESTGFFDVAGALSRCEETQPCRSCKALFALRAAERAKRW